MKIDQDQYNELLLEILKTLPPQLADDEITAQMVADASGYSINGARVFLDRQVAAGLLEKHEVMRGKQLMMAYRKVVK